MYHINKSSVSQGLLVFFFDVISYIDDALDFDFIHLDGLVHSGFAFSHNQYSYTLKQYPSNVYPILFDFAFYVSRRQVTYIVELCSIDNFIAVIGGFSQILYIFFIFVCDIIIWNL